MQSESKIVDDMARLASGAVGAAQGIKREIDAAVRARFERLLENLDLVGRDEFEAVREMAANARAENEVLKARLAKLEKRAAPKSRKSTGKKSTAPKRPARKTTRPAK